MVDKLESKELNVVFIGSVSFPLGAATSKRRRYMVDYLNGCSISSHVLVTDFRHSRTQVNPQEGKYGEADYFDLSLFASLRHASTFIKKGKEKLSQWYAPGKKNCLVFPTIMEMQEYPLYRYALKLGYHVVFDQVETSYLLNGPVPLPFRIRVTLGEWLSRKAYKKHPAFVISSALLKENRQRYRHRQLCILPNSTPVFCHEPKPRLSSPLRLMYSGSFAPKDGVGYLIDGVIGAVEAGVRCELFLVGKGNPKDMKILGKAQGKDYIHYLGFVSDEELIDNMRESDVLCMTRLNSKFANYGFPFKLSEYLATGNLVLATDVGDVTKYVQDKHSALVIPPEDASAISAAIKYVVDNECEALSIARNGLEAMQTHFSIDRVGRIFVSFLNSI